MRSRYYFVFVLLTALYSIITVCLIISLYIKFNTPKDESDRKSEKSKATSPFRKTFIYLTETEQCLPPNLASSFQIGDPTTCNCDVIVLSFQAECRDEAPSHVSYLFDPKTTWASGRNVLFFAAMDRRPHYRYYIYINDDTVLGFNEFTPPEMRKVSPFRVVENWLLDYEPAVGVVNYEWHNGAQVLLDRRKTLCGINKPSLVLPTVFFDAIFNAFHFKAVAYILPYSTQYEFQTWFAANKRVVSAVEMKFPGQALLFAPVTAHNPKHREYPYKIAAQEMLRMWREIIEEIKQEAPPKLRNNVLFEQFKIAPERYTTIESRTFCMNATRHQPIAPYRHFGREF